MTDTSTDPVINEMDARKIAHAQDIVAAFEATKAVIDSRSELYLGGIPDKLSQVRSFLNQHQTVIMQAYGLVSSEPTGTFPPIPD